MAASRFSSDVLQLFCGSILQEENRRQNRNIELARVAKERCIDFYLARNDFNGWLRSSKMDVQSRLLVQRQISAIRAKNKSKVY